MTVSQHIRALPLFLRLLLSTLGGVLIASLLFTFVLMHGEDRGLLQFGMIAVFLFLVAMMIAAPFIAILFITALIFQKSVQRHILPWCIAAPLAVWFAAAFLGAKYDEGNLYFLGNLLHELGDNWIFLFFSTPCAVLFYLAGRK